MVRHHHLPVRLHHFILRRTLPYTQNQRRLSSTHRLVESTFVKLLQFRWREHPRFAGEDELASGQRRRGKTEAEDRR